MTATTEEDVDARGRAPEADRWARLRASARRLATNAKAPPLERALPVLGGILMPLGLVFMVLGWVGVASTPRPHEQASYLASGSIIGLGLAVLGGFLYFAYWLTQIVQEIREQSERQVAAQARHLSEHATLLMEMLDAVVRPGGADGPAPDATRARDAGDGDALFAVGDGTTMHRPGCSRLANRADLRPVTRGDGLRPCRLCLAPGPPSR